MDEPSNAPHAGPQFDDAEEAAARAIIEDALKAALVRFYEKIRADDLIGPMFARVVHDWDAHIRTMQDFWSRAILGTERYNGQPFQPHVGLGVRSEHFDRWLALWKQAAEETMPEPLAEHVVGMASNMSHCWGAALERLAQPGAPAPA
ncbi:MAG: group III truncated hemoglobin [Beijerinckiaceae bacterium]